MPASRLRNVSVSHPPRIVAFEMGRIGGPYSNAVIIYVRYAATSMPSDEIQTSTESRASRRSDSVGDHTETIRSHKPTIGCWSMRDLKL